MKKEVCRNCGHDLHDYGVMPHKNTVQFKHLPGLVCCGARIEGVIMCGCTNPQPKEVEE